MSSSPTIHRMTVTLLALGLSACASIVGGGSSQSLSISSQPTGARVTIDSADAGSTPYIATLKRKPHHVVRLELAGYQPYELALDRGTNGWVWGNIVFGGIPGLVVDAITGAMYKIKPEQVSGTLSQQNASVQVTRDKVYVLVVLQADPAWEPIGSLVPLAPALGR